MSLLKILLILFVAAVLWVFLRLVTRVFGLIMAFKAVANQHHRPHSHTNPKNLNQTMVQCTKCNLYVLESEAIMYQGKPYCSKEHTKD